MLKRRAGKIFLPMGKRSHEYNVHKYKAIKHYYCRALLRQVLNLGRG